MSTARKLQPSPAQLNLLAHMIKCGGGWLLGDPLEPSERTIASAMRSIMLPDRFWAKVDKNGPIPAHRPDLGPCWVWTAGKSKGGYGLFWLAGSMRYVHRLAYAELRGEIKLPQLDHLCRNVACCNPLHLEPVTNAVNAARGNAGAHYGRRTHCSNGHEFTPENTYRARGQRVCRACNRVGHRRARKAARAA